MSCFFTCHLPFSAWNLAAMTIISCKGLEWFPCWYQPAQIYLFLGWIMDDLGMIKWKHLNRHQVKHLLRFQHQQQDKHQHHQHNKIKKRVSNNSARLARARGWFSNAFRLCPDQFPMIGTPWWMLEKPWWSQWRSTPPVLNRIESSNINFHNNYH